MICRDKEGMKAKQEESVKASQLHRLLEKDGKKRKE
jgi:hypothetical protein